MLTQTIYRTLPFFYCCQWVGTTYTTIPAHWLNHPIIRPQQQLNTANTFSSTTNRINSNVFPLLCILPFLLRQAILIIYFPFSYSSAVVNLVLPSQLIGDLTFYDHALCCYPSQSLNIVPKSTVDSRESPVGSLLINNDSPL